MKKYAFNSKANLNILIVTICSIFFAGCGSDEEALFGPCIVINQEPVLNLVSAINESTQEPIEQIQLSNIRINGGTELDFIEESPPFSHNIEVDYEQDILTCTLPCGFGKAEGEWEFTATAAGYQESDKSIFASYGVFDGGCPAYLREGTEATVILTPTTNLKN
ncbi:hypothetical protein FLL45_08920 [Aliikangiella marina]|uniref:Lipoprotein n=1 Tax=Aliikangiella marina TaxID=1712262 RepID=A0A545TCV4_9GAMM|nr:hypothetical protein [Aliikangiella marina]TQV75052.1 hypothetical protein FLL45_08920 [Aliikangiella marina]